MKLKKIFSNGRINILLKYSSIKYIALIIAFLKGIVNAGALGPELLGVLGNLLLILSYLSYSNLGILYSMNREYVIYESTNEKDKASKVISTSFTALLVLSILLIAAGIIAKFIYKDNLGNYILLVFIIGILEQYRSFYINYYRLVNKVRKINFIELINNVLSFVLIIISIKYFKIYSVLIAMFIADIIVFIYGYKNSEKIKLSIDKKVLKDLIIVGVPLLIYNLGFYILTTVDRLMTINFLGYRDLGYYTFSNQLVNGTMVFISSVLFLYYPKVIKNLYINGNNDRRQILKRIEQYTRYVEVLGVVLCLVGIILIKPFTNIILPKYSVSIDIYRILVFGGVFSEISYFANVFTVSNKKQIYSVYLQCLATAAAVILNYIFIESGMGIIGVSLATLMTNILYSIMQHLIYLKILNLKISFIRNTLKVYLKFTSFTVICIALSFININFILYIVTLSAITFILYYRNLRNMIIDMGKL
ncbi:polysaccharide biosynthesis protein [Clostridium autoethanogenum]|nr:oligosaccharide flippase family protein [Clostridium autoethanogenum]RMC97661.1 polysaccharide biosynthesis protein [Clostridium autoethanogenum]